MGDHVYITGGFSGSLALGSAVSLNSAGAQDIFVAKLDAWGRPLWATAMGGSGDDAGHAIAVDSLGNVVLTGSFSANATFGSSEFTSDGHGDVFAVKLGEPAIGSPGTCVGTSCIVRPSSQRNGQTIDTAIAQTSSVGLKAAKLWSFSANSEDVRCYTAKAL